MPIYEYRCNNCKKKVALLILDRTTHPVCSHCNSTNLTRLFSRFSSPRSEEARLESLADPAKWGDIDENDPASMARAMKKMGRELGEDIGDDFEQEIDSAVEDTAHEHGHGDE